ncbi:GNAT family N-acetyltransferase [Dyadobacter diqingensis]|uniref:GNAT family N-acetyltransferase n=1 Tax=Dyadobacter diqingensis TaxID=2938121 RepID=UPI0020C219E4|nr:GNAT family N-acetyltransferase [Dyadobacter diqingensis]
MEIRIANTKEDIEFCSNALLTFRPNVDPDTLVEQTLRMMQEGFRLIYIADDNSSHAEAIAGFRTFEMLRTGEIIYIDDLFTFPENRGKGYASSLLDHIHGLALKSGIKTVHLDSGFPLYPAHRLYLSKGYFLACHHFAKPISDN